MQLHEIETWSMKNSRKGYFLMTIWLFSSWSIKKNCISVFLHGMSVPRETYHCDILRNWRMRSRQIRWQCNSRCQNSRRRESCTPGSATKWDVAPRVTCVTCAEGVSGARLHVRHTVRARDTRRPRWRHTCTTCAPSPPARSHPVPPAPTPGQPSGEGRQGGEGGETGGEGQNDPQKGSKTPPKRGQKWPFLGVLLAPQKRSFFHCFYPFKSKESRLPKAAPCTISDKVHNTFRRIWDTK